LAADVSVLIADDHEVVRHGLRTFLDLQPGIAVVGEARDGREAIERVGELDPDVVLMDIVMPELDGIGATHELRLRAPRTKVLALSSFSDDERVLPALRAGAVGYLTKDTRPDELADAIRTVDRGEPVLCTEATRRVLAQLESAKQRPQGTVTVAFTDIEGSTRLVDSLGDEGARALFRAHDQIVRAVVVDHDGVEVEKEGDSFMLAFAGVRRALACASRIQRALDSEGPKEVRVRVGLNTGDVIAEADRYFGRAVFVAARVAAQAAGGEVLVSEVTRSLAGDGDFRFLERGTCELRGLKGPHRLYELDWRAA
jgi:DNA-binding NarL/FixJ family response regulator